MEVAVEAEHLFVLGQPATADGAGARRHHIEKSAQEAFIFFFSVFGVHLLFFKVFV
jgi:hypothetical protein